MEDGRIYTQPLRTCQILFVLTTHTEPSYFFSSCFICRYPTNKWVKLGTFHARDERIVQSFPLDEQLYAKYVKVLLFFFFFFSSSCCNSTHSSTRGGTMNLFIHSCVLLFRVDKYTHGLKLRGPSYDFMVS